METTRTTRFGAPLITALAVLVAACTAPAGGGVPGVTSTQVASTDSTAPSVAVTTTATAEGSSLGLEASAARALPDITARPISLDELTAMLPGGETGPAATDGRVTATRSNEDLVTSAVLDRSDEVADIDRFGRINGVGAAYPSGTRTAHVWIDLFASAEGAAGWAADTAGDIVKQMGGSHQASIDLTSADEYPIEVGEGSVGLILTLDGGTRTETIALFHLGRIAVFVSIVESGDGDLRVPVHYLAEEAAEGVLQTLLGTPAPGPQASGPGSFDFSFERTVAIGGSVWTTAASGTVDYAGVACTVAVNHPDLRVERSFIRVGGRLWVRNGTGAYESLGTAGVVDRQLLTMCPAWPVELTEAGLAGALTGTPAGHVVAGVPALGYRGTAADLEQAVGLDASTVTVDVFNLWVAEGTPWLVEIDIAVTGDTSMLVPLIGTGFPEGESATVTISQQATSIGEAGPVSPPG